MSEHGASKGRGLTLVAGIVAGFLFGVLVGTKLDLTIATLISRSAGGGDLVGDWIGANTPVHMRFRRDGTASWTQGDSTVDFQFVVEGTDIQVEFPHAERRWTQATVGQGVLTYHCNGREYTFHRVRGQ